MRKTDNFRRILGRRLARQLTRDELNKIQGAGYPTGTNDPPDKDEWE